MACEKWHDFLHEIKSEKYDEIQKIENFLDRACNSEKPVLCAEVFKFAGIECPTELVGYGWHDPYSLYLDGYFYAYRGGLDNYWHIEFPQPELIEQEE